MTTVRRSIQSSSCSRCTNAAAHRLQDKAEAEATEKSLDFRAADSALRVPLRLKIDAIEP